MDINIAYEFEPSEIVTRKNGSRVLKHLEFYENEFLMELQAKPRKFFVFVRQFELVLSKTGRVHIDSKKDIRELTGRTYKDCVDALDRFTDGCEGMVPSMATRSWVPEIILELKKAIKKRELKI